MVNTTSLKYRNKVKFFVVFEKKIIFEPILFATGVEVAEFVEFNDVIESDLVIVPDEPDSDFVLSFNFLNIFF